MIKAPKPDERKKTEDVTKTKGNDFEDYFLKRELLSSIAWRQRLPVLGAVNPASPEDLLRDHRSILTDLGRDLSRLLSDEALARRFLEERRSGNRHQA